MLHKTLSQVARNLTRTSAGTANFSFSSKLRSGSSSRCAIIQDWDASTTAYHHLVDKEQRHDLIAKATKGEGTVILKRAPKPDFLFDQIRGGKNQLVIAASVGENAAEKIAKTTNHLLHLMEKHHNALEMYFSSSTTQELLEGEKEAIAAVAGNIRAAKVQFECPNMAKKMDANDRPGTRYEKQLQEADLGQAERIEDGVSYHTKKDTVTKRFYSTSVSSSQPDYRALDVMALVPPKHATRPSLAELPKDGVIDASKITLENGQFAQQEAQRLIKMVVYGGVHFVNVDAAQREFLIKNMQALCQQAAQQCQLKGQGMSDTYAPGSTSDQAMRVGPELLRISKKFASASITVDGHSVELIKPARSQSRFSSSLYSSIEKGQVR